MRFRVVCSTEAAEVPRVFYIDGEDVRGLEVLVHDEAAVDLSFMNSGRAPLLVDHLQDRQVGVFDGVALGGGQLVGEGRFSRAERAQDEVLDVRDGIRRNVSVGYIIKKFEVVRRRGQLPLFRVTSWKPFETSILSVPADMGGATIEARSDEQREFTTLVRKAPTVDEEITNEQTEQRGGAITIERPSREDDERRIRDELKKKRVADAKAIRATAAAHNASDLGEESIRSGHSFELFQGILLDFMETVGKADTPLHTPAAQLGMSRKEQQQFSFARILDFMAIDKPTDKDIKKVGFELECSRAVADQLGKPARGVYIPQDMMESQFAPELAQRNAIRNATQQVLTRTHTVGVAADGGNLVGTDHLGGSFIEVLYNSMQVRNLGARVLSGLRGNIQIPRRTAGGGTRWTAEQSAAVTGGNLDIGDSTFDQVPMQPRELTSTSLMTRRLIQQSDPSIEALVRSDLAMAIALAVDSAAINGDNTADPNQPDGIFNAAGTNNISLGTPDGGALTYAQAVEFIRIVMAANALGVGNLGWLMNANGWARGMTISRDPGSGQFLIRDGRFVEHRFEISEQVPSNLVEGASGAVLNGLIFAAWSSLMIGEWGVLELQVDPYTAVATGAVRINAFMTLDIALRYPQAFAFSVDMQ